MNKPWRVGSKIPINVYDGDRPVCQCQTALDARKIVCAVNKYLEGHEALAIYAWVGADEHGSGKVGLKQGIVPAGTIPLVAMNYHLDRLAKLKPQMEAQAAASGKKIRLVKFVEVEIAAETKAGS
jgi:hypothetical protein